jgi:hypothetical protein
MSLKRAKPETSEICSTDSDSSDDSEYVPPTGFEALEIEEEDLALDLEESSSDEEFDEDEETSEEEDDDEDMSEEEEDQEAAPAAAEEKKGL